MTDVHDKATRSYNMRQIRSKNTKPELIVRKFLFARGVFVKKKAYIVIIIKQKHGTRYEIFTPNLSVIAPWIGGKNAPPTMAIFNKAEALPENAPTSSMPRLKSVGNIMPRNKPKPARKNSLKPVSRKIMIK